MEKYSSWGPDPKPPSYVPELGPQSSFLKILVCVANLNLPKQEVL